MCLSIEPRAQTGLATHLKAASQWGSETFRDLNPEVTGPKLGIFLPLCGACLRLALFFFPLWTAGHCYFRIYRVSLLEGTISVQGSQSSSPVSTLPAGSLAPIANGSWEHQVRVPGAGLDIDSGHCCQGQMQDRNCFERSLFMEPNSSRRAKMQGSSKFLELLG